jgi:hypothetical protein
MPFYSLSSSGGLVEAATFAALPATGATGTLYVVTATNTLYRWSGSAYVEVSASPAEVVEGANLAAFPATGAAGKIYVALDTGKTYRWGGSSYVEVSGSDWGTISNKPSTFAPSAHAASHATGGGDAVTLAVSQVSGLQTAIDSKAAASHTHSAADITSGTIAAARLPATVVQRDAGTGAVELSAPAAAAGSNAGDLNILGISYDASSVFGVFGDGSVSVSGTLTAAALSGSVSGSDITSGTISAARLGAHASTHSAGGSDAATLCETFLFTRSSKPATASGSSGSYTWSVPALAKYIMIDATGPGGGGGSGRRGAAGTICGGGGGGGSGGRTIYEFPVSELGANLGLTILVGPGGAGGAAVAANDTNGNAGAGGTLPTDVTVTATGAFLARGWNATGGAGGTSSAGGGGGSGSWVSTYGSSTGGAGGGSTPTGSTPGFGTQAAQAGGGGGGISAADSAGAGGAGYSREISRNLAGNPAGGAAGGGAGLAGIAAAPGGSGGGGSGGGASITTAAGSGGNGAACGGGGGGGGASLNGFNSGAGGNGGDGIVRITVWY